MTLFYVMLAAIFTIIVVILVKRRSEPVRMERYQQEFRKRYEETLDIGANAIVSEALMEGLNQAMEIEYYGKGQYRLPYETPTLYTGECQRIMAGIKTVLRHDGRVR